MKFYEQYRLMPFRNAQPGYHSNADLRDAYHAWANAEPGRRELLWCVYCDIRDGYAIGTNAERREQLRKQQDGYIEARYARLSTVK